jgi:polar amino acid transport system ATP-binding protein
MKSLADDGMTMLVVTHEMWFAREVVDRVLFLDGGVIVGQGPAREPPGAPQHPRTQDSLRRALKPIQNQTFAELLIVTRRLPPPSR